jgi:2-dehydropantoate 2-reductase
VPLSADTAYVGFLAALIDAGIGSATASVLPCAAGDGQAAAGAAPSAERDILPGETAMRVLVVGAGAIGGYFGGRLLESGRDVTFLVRPKRAAKLAETGLTIRSPQGDFHAASPQTVTADTLAAPFDLILLSCKAYDLDSALDDLAPAVGPETAILPLLNGMKHIDKLDERFGAERVLGGQCAISTTLDAEGRILHLNDLHALTYGERDGSRSARIEAVTALFAGAKFQPRLSESIMQEMWDKWVFIAAGAGITCLMRAAVGDIVAAGAGDLTTGLFDEAASIAAASGYPLQDAVLQRGKTSFTTPGSRIMASMLRDIERGGPIEADHIIGDLLGRAPQPNPNGLLRIVYAHLKAYEARRAYELTKA